MKTPSPGTDAEWARAVEARLRKLETSSAAVRVGQWVLVDRGGDLVAVSADGRAYTLSSSVILSVQTAAAEVAPPAVYRRVVTITLTGWITGGDFTLTFAGETTDPIPTNASAAAVLAALGALPNYSPADFTVAGGDGGPWTVGIPGVTITGDNSGIDYVPLFGGDVVIT